MNLTNFIHQKSYEKIVQTVRRHPVTFVPQVITFIVLSAAPIIVGFVLNTAFPSLFSNQTLYVVGILSASGYYLCLCLFFYSYFVAFYLDMWIITNDRFIDVRQISLFARSVSETDLYLIQDATSEVSGLFASLFDYGNVSIQTAGAVPKFILHQVPNPHGLRTLLLNLAAEDKKFHNTPPPATNNQ